MTSVQNEAPVFHLSTIQSLGEIDSAEWDRCANPVGQPTNPFVKHRFLKALEESRSVGHETGWQPLHLTLRDTTDRILGVAPLYAKTHSYGEYIFDWAWADAYERAGGRYFPKLLCAVPFTPASGPRLLARTDTEVSVDHIRHGLIQGLIQIVEQTGSSGVHVNFTTKVEAERAQSIGMMKRLGLQFHWHNHRYGSFDDFLSAFSSRKRKAVKKERREAQALGLTIRALQGKEITEAHWDSFFRFYINTSDRKWGSAYLTRDFFSLIDPNDVVLVMAFEGQRPVAGALNLLGSDCLYGRNWGCENSFKMLHFETCYYQAIEFAIANKLERVEAGAQGHHKLQRGYLPSETYSVHWIKDPSLDQPVRRFVASEAEQVQAEIKHLIDTENPYKSI